MRQLLRVGAAVPRVGAAAVVLLGTSVVDAADAVQPKSRAVDVVPVLAAARERHEVPGMAAALLHRGTLVTGADGVRKAGAAARATVNDRWHLGSCTKSMTATLCALLVEERALSFDGTVAAAFPELATKIDAGWKGATLAHLLHNSGGAPTDLSRDGLWGRLWAHRGDARSGRRLLVEGVLGKPPVGEPGKTYVYSNAGFSIAGAMAEKATGTAYEELIEKRLFAPLGITTAGFGAPGRPGAIDEPWGHRDDGAPVEPGDGADNPPAISPAGRVHMTMADWAKYVGLHLDAARGKPRLLSTATFRRLHEATDGDYAMGWGRPQRGWSKGPLLTHTGSNTMWFAVVWIAPERDLAVMVAANRAGKAAEKAADEVAWGLISAALLGDDEDAVPGR